MVAQEGANISKPTGDEAIAVLAALEEEGVLTPEQITAKLNRIREKIGDKADRKHL